MKIKLINNNSKNLITFLTGWGCDSNQFRFMKSSENDILMIYDYTDLALNFDFSKYEHHYLISFSAGVFMAGMLKNILPEFEKSIAVNGNPEAYDKYFGLTKEIVDIFQGVTIENAIDFRREYLVFDEKELKLFNANQSHRSIESCREELKSLREYDKTNPEPQEFTFAILSRNDKIFNPQHQQEYWEKRTRCLYLENSAHFPFFTIDDFDKIINL